MGAGAIRILLVEDNPGDARLLREFLKEAPGLRFDLTRVERLAEAREHLAASPVDVILLDLSLPDAHGMETVEQMVSPAGNAPIIVLTGLDDEDIATRAVQAGAQDYLAKGRVDGHSLGRAIRYAVERKRLEVERSLLLGREKAARAKAEQAVQGRDEVLRVVAHDLGNSLSAVALTASALLRKLPDDAESGAMRQGIANIRQLTEQMQRLRQDLLDVAVIEAGQFTVDREWVEPGPVVLDVVDNFQVLAAEKSLTLEGRVGDGLQTVMIDAARVRQVLTNLVVNAVKFTPAGGAVTVSVNPDGDGARFSTCDTGPGIPAEYLPQLFDRFWRAPSTRRQGAGLGLAIARGIVEAHGGRIWADSEVGKGSCFHFVIPAKAGMQ